MANEELETYSDGYSSLSIRVPGKETVFVSNEARIMFHGANELDEQKPTGGNLGRLKGLGVRLTMVTVSFLVLAEDEANFWGKVYPLLREKGNRGNAPPLDLINPQATRANMTTVTVSDYDIGDPNPRDGREVTIKFKEWAPAPVKPKPVDNAKTQFGPPTLQQFIAENAEVNVFR